MPIIQTPASQPAEIIFDPDKSINAAGILAKTSAIIRILTSNAPTMSAAPALRLLRRIRLIPAERYNNTNCRKRYIAAMLKILEKRHNKIVYKAGKAVSVVEQIKVYLTCFFMINTKYCFLELNREMIRSLWGIFDVIKTMARIIFIKLQSITKSGNGSKENSLSAVFSR